MVRYHSMTGQTKNPSTSFADRLKEAQASARLTNRELALACDVDQRVIARWRKGDVHPNFQNVSKIARATNRPLEFFAEEEAAA